MLELCGDQVKVENMRSANVGSSFFDTKLRVSDDLVSVNSTRGAGPEFTLAVVMDSGLARSAQN
jgi:hypothetical protein